MNEAVYQVGWHTLVVRYPRGFKVKLLSSRDGYELDIVPRPKRNSKPSSQREDEGGQ